MVRIEGALWPTACALAVAAVLATAAAQEAAEAYTWGELYSSNSSSQNLGSPLTSSIPLPLALPAGVALPLLASGVGNNFACILDARGQAYCAGGNESKQLGSGNASFKSAGTFLPVASSRPYVALSLSQWAVFACGLAADGAAECWGLSSLEMINSAVPVPVLPGRSFSAIGAGLHHLCAIERNTSRVICIGPNEAQLGRGFGGIAEEVKDDAAYIDAPASLRFVQIGSGNLFSCALTDTGSAWCWGDNSMSAVGNGTTGGTAPSPVAVVGGHRFVQLSVGGNHACGVKADGQMWCWGDNSSGQLGCGPACSQGSPSPAKVAGSYRWAQAAAAVYYSCALTVAGQALCWGKGYLGDATLGRGPLDASAGRLPQPDPALQDTARPYPVVGAMNFTSLAAGYGAVIGLSANANRAAAPAAAVLQPAPVQAASPARSPQAPPPQPLSSQAPSAASSVPIGAIIGGVAAGVAALAALAAFVVLQRRKHRRRSTAAVPALTRRLTPANAPDALTPSLAGTTPRLAGALPYSYATSHWRTSFTSLDQTPSDGSLDSDELLSFINSELALALGRGHTLQGGPAVGRAVPQPSDSLQHWQLQWADVRPLRFIGHGSYGRVYLAAWAGTQVALKVLVRQASGAAHMSLQLPDSVLQQLQEEATILSRLRHPNIVAFLGLINIPPCLLTEYCARGSLYDLLALARQPGPEGTVVAAALTWRRRFGLLLDAAAGLSYLHAKKILHRDVKTPNLLVDEQWRIKVADFNLSRLLGAQAGEASGSGALNPVWAAPEVLQGQPAAAASDVYSFGMVCIELATWRLPWAPQDPPDLEAPGDAVRDVRAMLFRVATRVRRGDRPVLPPPEELPGPHRLNEHCLEAFYSLIRDCWAADPEHRPSFAELMPRLQSLVDST